MEDQERQLATFQRIDALRNEAFYQNFAGIPLHGWGQSGPTFYAYLPKANRYFIDSNYYYRNKLEFFHLTSINNLWSILNSRAFRLYNLHSSKDETEYKYAAEILGLTDNQINIGKQYTYTLSFCPISELKTEKIWNLYGDNFKGAAIVFEVLNDPIDWINFHISEIKYDDAHSFNSFRNRIKEIQSEFQGIIETSDLSQLICFHKTAKWLGEKEVRIATYFPFKRPEEYWKYSKTEFRLENGRNRITNYIELPIWVDNDSSWIKNHGLPELDRTQNLPADYFTTKPKLKVKDILIGANSGIQIEEFEKFRTALIETIRFNYGYNADLSFNFFEL